MLLATLYLKYRLITLALAAKALYTLVKALTYAAHYFLKSYFTTFAIRFYIK
jgi:hypothetical protein